MTPYVVVSIGPLPTVPLSPIVMAVSTSLDDIGMSLTPHGHSPYLPDGRILSCCVPLPAVVSGAVCVTTASKDERSIEAITVHHRALCDGRS